MKSYTLIKIKIVFRVIFKVINWSCPIFHYFNLKKNKCIVRFRSGLKCIVRNKSDAVVFFENFFLDSYEQEGLKIKEEDTVLDIGAHVGYFTIYASKKANKGKVFAFEPSKESYKILEENIKLNKLKNVQTENYGVLNKSGISVLYVDKENQIGNTMFEDKKGSIKENVNVISIRDIIEKKNIEKIDFLKLDCEGAEYEIILNLPKEILNKIKIISMEVHKIEKLDITDIEKFLNKNNFQVKRKFLLSESSANWPMLYAKNQNFVEKKI
jgi:FkbM family methyltransferase